MTMDRKARLLKRLHIAASAPLKESSRKCLRNLSNYKPSSYWKTKRLPAKRSAAVLVALFVSRSGDLYVLLNRRSSTLKTYAGDTSLPGGRFDPVDASPEDTARREAFEEIGLPKSDSKVPLLCVLEPFLSGNQLIVTPVVVLINDVTIEPVLNRPEVESLFSHPLQSLLSTRPPLTMETILPEARNASWDDLKAEYYTYTDLKWVDNQRKIRLHRFLTGKEGEGIKPIFGLTASILIRVAQIGYGRAPSFRIRAPEEPSMRERIEFAMRHHPLLQDAAKEEGLHEWYDDDDDGDPGSTFILRGRL